jgi:hypothetical protein
VLDALHQAALLLPAWPLSAHFLRVAGGREDREEAGHGEEGCREGKGERVAGRGVEEVRVPHLPAGPAVHCTECRRTVAGEGRVSPSSLASCCRGWWRPLRRG